MMKILANAHLSRLLSYTLDRDIEEFAKLTVDLTYDLSKITDKMKSQALLNLRRGWSSAVTGKSYMLHQILCTVFDIPVYAIGRSDMCVISIKKEGPLTHEGMLEQLKALFLLEDAHANSSYWGWRSSAWEGHNPAWLQLHYMRPPSLDIKGMCHLLQVDSIHELINKNHVRAATQAIVRGALLDLSKLTVK